MFCPLKKLQQGEKSMKLLMDSGKRTRGRWQLVQDDRWARHYTGDWLQKFSHSLGKWDCTFSLVFLVSVNIHTNTHSYQLTHRNIQEVNMCCLVLPALWIIIILASLCLVLFPFAYFISLGLLKTLFIAFVLRSYDFFVVFSHFSCSLPSADVWFWWKFWLSTVRLQRVDFFQLVTLCASCECIKLSLQPWWKHLPKSPPVLSLCYGFHSLLLSCASSPRL